MRLKSIKLAGFKSFVDPTTVSLPRNLTAIVGPNGCGKSNVIDAVRWVMGETSAKHLRGESMADVIFNGSNSRKPVSQAFIELVFDNTEGRLVGEYAQYNEIAIKRQVTRDGQSNYYFNGTKCRRKDITDLFLGTGLGPRSYAIIEQGMISKLIEAKPEELRVFIEEAAGISKYKERRRETENRIRRTRENLERLEDIREELERQLQHLHRQAQSAEKYKQFKEDERLFRAQLQALQWRKLDNQVTEKETIIRDLEVKVEALVTDRVNCESEIEKRRESHLELTEAFNTVQARYYDVGTEIARIETNIQNLKDRQAQLKADLEQTEASFVQANEERVLDEEKLEELNAQLAEIEPELELALAAEEQSNEALEIAEEKMQGWQAEWDQFNQSASEPKQRAQVEQSRIQHLEQSLQRLRERVQRLDQESETLTAGPMEQEAKDLSEEIAEHDLELEAKQEKVDTLIAEIDLQREQNSQQAAELDENRSQVQTSKGRKASLEALQQAALGQQSDGVGEWLENHDLTHKPRLAEQLSVQPGWEKAVETVLGNHLQAVCVDKIDDISELVTSFEQGSLTLLEPSDQTPAAVAAGTSLADYVESDARIGVLLSGVIAVESLNDALAVRAQLSAQESVITKEGIWIGSNWLRVAKDEDAQAGVIQRQKELESIDEALATAEEKVAELTETLATGREHLRALEQQREDAQKALSEANRVVGDLKSQLSGKQVRLEQIAMRRERIESESKECQEQIEQEQETLGEARMILQEALDSMENDSNRREELLTQRDDNRRVLDEIRQKARHDKDHAHQLQLRNQSLQTQIESIKVGMDRLSSQVQSLQARLDNLRMTSSTDTQSDDPALEMQAQLEELLEKRIRVEEELAKARSNLEGVDHEMREFEKRRSEADESVQGVRMQLESVRMEWRGFQVERDNLEKLLSEAEYDLKAVLDELPEEASEEAWEQELDKIANRISRLGAINLAAIDEYKAQSERKTYLDTQYDDLTDALEILEGAIKKIDRETRTRFKETFDRVNRGLQELFPKVFGGGHAYLELTGEDLLDTGVAIMARPPGKRNSTIHLLSGGEKALTAIALVFSIFQLNPAPFCMLDEVDAPLDDANVGRYSRIVKEMSAKVQFIYITHNKIAMEMADHLMGVTMHEPGCSRLVSVDVEEAAALAAM